MDHLVATLLILMSFPPCGNLGKRSSGFRQSGPIDRRHRRSRSAPLNLNVRTPDPGAATNLLRPEEVGLKIQCHRPGDPRRCRLARFAASSHTREYRAHAASVLRAGAELSRPFDRLRTSTNIGAAIATVAASRAPARRSSTLAATPGMPGSPNPRSSPQSEPEIGHRSRFRAVGMRGHFRTDQAAMKLLYLVLRQVAAN
jgi:hypothetical protein